MIYTDGIHLVADSIRELYSFAKSIELKRNYFEGARKNHPHYDLTNEFILKKALDAGAKIIGTKELLDISKGMKNATDK